QSRFADEYATAPADPATLGNHGSRLQRAGKDEVEGGGQQETVANQRIAGVEGRVVHHLEVERAMGRTGGMEGCRVDLEADARKARLGNLDFGLELAVDRRAPIER